MKRLFLLLFFLSIMLSLTGFSASERLVGIEQLELKVNTRYRIYRKIDLKGGVLQIPEGCVLAFRGGSISNGTIVFNETVIKGHPRFKNCHFNGNVKIRKIDDRDFTSPDDNNAFVFLFRNAVINGIKCDFYRDYHISMAGVNSNGLIHFEDITSGADIRFHDCSLYNTFVFPSRIIKPVIVLRDVRNITIRNGSFHDVDGHNARLSAQSKGCTFIHCYGDCKGINLLSCYQENGDCILRSGVFQHMANMPYNTPFKGLINSTLIVKSKNTGYGLALYCGDNLSIDIDVESPHRGFYCTGVSNSTITYRGFNPQETKCHILIKDAVYKRMNADGSYSLDMKACSNLKIKAILDRLLPKERVIVFSTYGSGRKENADFRFRSEPCNHHNMDITADIKHYPNEEFYSIISVFSDSGALNNEDMIGNRVTDVIVHDIHGIGGNANRYLCMLQPYTETQIGFVNCTSHDPDFGYNLQIQGNAKGSLHMRNGNIEKIYVREKDAGKFDFDIENTRVKGGVVYIKNQTAKELIRISSNVNL